MRRALRRRRLPRSGPIRADLAETPESGKNGRFAESRRKRRKPMHCEAVGSVRKWENAALRACRAENGTLRACRGVRWGPPPGRIY